jgi:hypothetical protein
MEPTLGESVLENLITSYQKISPKHFGSND